MICRNSLGLPPSELCSCGCWTVSVLWLGICDLHWCQKCGRRWSFRENQLDGYYDPSGQPKPHPAIWQSPTHALPAVNAVAIVVADKAAKQLDKIVRAHSEQG